MACIRGIDAKRTGSVGAWKPRRSLEDRNCWHGAESSATHEDEHGDQVVCCPDSIGIQHRPYSKKKTFPKERL